MEDSRNIIKAIDALTLKVGGEVVDSKNITEAIDHLKAVYDQEAIGIDDTLTQEGLAADAKAVGDKIDEIYNKRIFYTSDAINTNNITFSVKSVNSCGLIIANINGIGNEICCFVCNNKVITFVHLAGTGSEHITASYNDNFSITLTTALDKSFRDVIVLYV